MRLHRLSYQQDLPIDQAEAWAFFSDPRNLAVITPPELGLVPIGEVGDRMYPGQIIHYRVRIAPLIRCTWVTEITHVEPGHAFVDEQRFGPYRFWHHRHWFEPTADGTRCHDLVHYGLWGPFSGLIDALLVQRQIAKIFAYRRRVLDDRFAD